MKRSRRGGRRPQHSNHNQNGGGGGGGGGNGNGGGYNPNRTYDSTGPEVKIRGSASHVYEKYLQLARDANTSGDRVMAENYLQHAEHYYRILAAQVQQQQQYQQQRDQQFQNQNGQNGQAGQNGQTGQNGQVGQNGNVANGAPQTANGNTNGNTNGNNAGNAAGRGPQPDENGFVTSSTPTFDLSENGDDGEDDGDSDGNQAEDRVPENEGF